MKTTTLSLRNLMNRSPVQIAFLGIPLALAWFALSPQARAACQDACFANFNTVQGDNALLNLTTGFSNTAFGANALLSVTSASGNTAVGVNALDSDTTGYVNTAVGEFALSHNTTGIANTAVGAGALEVNEDGVQNTATGQSALQDNIGSNNTATGYNALFFNTTGNNNTAMGTEAMGGHPDIQMTGSNDTATGFQALHDNTTGSNNTADGYQVLYGNTTGINNTGIGYQALLHNTGGSFNIAVGNGAGGNLTTGINNIDIGNNGVAGESKTIRIGSRTKQTNTFIAGITGATVPTGVAVIVDASGHLGTTTSSARFKEAIKPMDKASEAILALKPVTFRYKPELDPEGIPQFGLVAEEVEKVNPDLVAHDGQGRPYTVRYEAVNAMLLNEFLKEHHQLQDLKAIVAEQQKQIKALASGLQKVNAQVELSKPAPQTVLNNQ
jgi:hypothetical protein